MTSHKILTFRTGQTLLAILSLLVNLFSPALLTQPALAASGDFSIDFVAAAPQSYNHLTGGGAYDDGTIGVDKDVVESLQGGDFACGDIVTYFATVTVDDTVQAETDAPQTIEMDFSFLADTTGQSGVAIGDIVLVQANYGTIEDLIAGENNVDDGIVDDGGSVATLTSKSLTGPLFQAGSELLGTVQLTDLERAEQVVVRIDVQLFCDPGSNPTGNLQAKFEDGQLTFINGSTPVEPPEALPGGAQTIPFKQIGEIEFPDIRVTKTADPTEVPEPGGDVTFTVQVYNDSTLAVAEIVSLVDDIHGNLHGQGSCSVPQTIQPGDSYSCSFTAHVAGNAGYSETDTVTATEALGDTDQDSATVTITDVPSSIVVTKTADPTTVPEPGGTVDFTVRVDNTSAADSVTIDTLSDSIHGDLNGQGTCSVPQTIAPGDFYECAFSTDVSGSVGYSETDVVTASGYDDDGNPVSASDDATVTIVDVPAAIEIVKTADPTSVDEPGGDVTFAFTINNLSAVDSVTINSLTDTVFGNLDGQGDCSVPQTIPVGGSYSCSFMAFVGGNGGETQTNVATASGLDDDGNPVSDSDDATVTVEDVQPVIAVVKTADPTEVPEGDGPVTFTVEVTNNSVSSDPVTINSLTDSIYGDLTDLSDEEGTAKPQNSTTCSVPQTIQPGDTYICTFSAYITGNVGQETNVATASGVDDEGNPISDSDNATVTITDSQPAIAVVKTANPTSVDEPGDEVTFTVEVTNNSADSDPVTITSLTDDVYGDLTDLSDEGSTAKPQNSTTCSVPQTIQPGDSYTCSFTADVSGNAGDSETDTATASGEDDEGNPVSASDDATVTVTDVQPAITVDKSTSTPNIDEPGGTASYTVVVTNNSVEPVTLNSLIDDVFGDLTLADNSTCVLPQTLAVGGSYSCSFDGDVAGNASETHVNTVTGSATDDEGNTATDTGSATVTFDDVQPVIAVTKTANPTEVPEPGADVTFTVVVENNSVSTDPVTISSLVDSIHGDLNGQGDCSVPQTIQPGDSYSCSFTAHVAGNAGYSETDIVTASGADDEGNPVSDSDDATVTVTDVQPAISVDKTASLTVIPEPGGPVQFTVRVTNDSVATDPVTINSLTDDIYGDLDKDDVGNHSWTSSTCDVPQTIQPGDFYECTFTADVNGIASDSQTDTVTASGVDDESNPVSDSDDATVQIVAPSAVTDSSLCDFGGQFRLIFTPDLQALPTYKLSGSNPGQFFYNALYLDPDMAGQTVTFDVTVPYPFVTQGAMPAHVYGSLALNEYGCFAPGDELDAQPQLIELDDHSGVYPDGSATIQITAQVPDSGFLYVNLHLDYGLKGRDPDGDGIPNNYDKSGGDDAVHPDDPANILIPNGADHTFSVGGATSDSQTVTNLNEFKRFLGFGGLVKNGGDEPVEDAQIVIKDSDGTELSDPDVAQGGVVLTENGLFTDEDGFYTLAWKHKGRQATYTVQLVGSVPLQYSKDGGPLVDCPDAACVVEVSLGRGKKFAQVDFIVAGP